MARIDEPRSPRLPQSPPRSEPTTTARPATPPARQQPTVGPRQPEPQADRFDEPIKTVNKIANTVKSVTDTILGTQTKTKTTEPFKFGPWNIGGSQNRTTVEPMNTRASRGASVLGTAASVAQLPGAAYTAVRDARNFFRNASAETGITALGSAASLVSTGSSAAKGIIETGNLISDFRAVRDVAARTMLDRVPDAARGVVNRVAGEVAQQTLDGASRQVVRNVGARLAGEGLESAARAGATAARAAAPGIAAATAGKAASRFVPGLNVAIAAADTVAFGSEVANAVRTGNPNWGKLATSGITALGSIAAATNIPVVSQVGAAVSTVSSLIGAFF